jgi:hypothetical protein
MYIAYMRGFENKPAQYIKEALVEKSLIKAKTE